MIPIRLELKNFMSYGEATPPLDLTGMHMVCLSGENGHGKSAILDAMTWALWGESRAGKNKHDELVRIGADEMSVQFTFAMDGQTYRILRKRSKKASGNQWELHQDDGAGGWRAQTGNNSSETEKAIQKLLRMSYDTFLNSAYLRQGHADHFVKQTPGKRKEILGEILDLSRYDQLEAKAKEKARTSAGEAFELERDLNFIDSELARESDYQEALIGLKQRQSALQAQRDALRAEWDAQRERRAALLMQKQTADRLQTEIKAYRVEIVDLTELRQEHQREAANWQALLTQQETICRDYEELTALRQRMDALDKAVDQWYRGQQHLSAAEKEWIAAEAQVQRRLDTARRDRDEAALRLRELPDILRRKAEVEARVAETAQKQARLQELTDEYQQAQQQFLRLEQESKYLTEQIALWDGRLQSLAEQRGTCRVCNAPLPPERIAATQQEYEQERESQVASRKQIWAQAKAAKTAMQAAEAERRPLDQALRSASDDQQRLGQLSQQALEYEVHQQRLPQLEAEFQEAARIVQEEDFAHEIKAKIEKGKVYLAKYATAEADRDAARVRLTQIADAERLHLQLGQAQEALTRAEREIGRADRTLAQRQQILTAAQTQLDGLTDFLTALEVIEAREIAIRAQEKERGEESRIVDQEIARQEHSIQHCAQQRLVRTEKSAQLAAAKHEAELHDQLAKACGKNGVQALIIDGAVPELQDEANNLLERLTDGDMSLYFETQRQARTKGSAPIETLEIKVSDSLGTRPLEMYSGGEGFRAAFALRIALSKLLSRRAGAKLQTLIIDEGFGTQDGKGREKLVDALNAIKDDFERIIVITHIDELKDAFASRIEVIKTPRGSEMTVLEGAAG